MKSTPEEHDPDWSKYPETILRFSGEPTVAIDLRTVLNEQTFAELRRIGLDGAFAVMTAFDPRGENLSAEENRRRSDELDERLRRLGMHFVRVDACSPDGAHCECSVAVKIPKEQAVRLAIEFEQVAIFWFDGRQFWIVGAMMPADPMMLPRSS